MFKRKNELPMHNVVRSSFEKEWFYPMWGVFESYVSHRMFDILNVIRFVINSYSAQSLQFQPEWKRPMQLTKHKWAQSNNIKWLNESEIYWKMRCKA